MKKLNIIIAGFFLTIITLSCSKSWLDPEPLSFYTPENVYKDPQGLASLAVTLKTDLKQETHNMNKGLHNLIMEFAASDLGSPWSQLDFYKLTPNNDVYYNFLKMFNLMFANVKNCNVLIARVESVEFKTEEEKNAMLAQGLFYRSYWYYRLVHSYGDVPFIGEEIEGAKLDFQSHSRTAILKKIQADLEFAAQWLPVSAGAGELTKGAANHLLTKVYLANLEFDKAIASASAVINGPYALMTERFGKDAANTYRNVMWDLHRPENVSLANNKETILATIDRFEAPADARSAGLFTMRYYGCSWFQAPVRDSEGKAGMVASGPMYDSLGRGNANVRLTGFYQYDVWSYKGATWKTTTDLRRADANWVDNHEYKYNNPSSKDFGKPVNPAYFADPLDTFRSIYAIPHYKLYVPEQNKAATPQGGNGDFYVFRLAETYLLRAEAYFWKGQLDLAAADINKVRTRAKALPMTAAEVTVDFIMDERARELFTEEPRHSEMVRISFILAAKNLQGYSLANFSEKNYYFDRVKRKNPTYDQKISMLGNVANIAPFHVLWPIPSTVITANTKGVINQNKGYDGAERNVPPIETIP
ncbi:RagB/SusD family nutrient uptake outer membrane protein [Sphingobacterium hotanense]|uniref:RagB/SusD family nutrient uptake outer membrane protein n=1 Tax=Sphingobacterium hotanense TaxID=649196 RepID=A0ABT7NJE2_9SPHI|nr:RagB/SusD family nutrient uptake outer membrane protein [Sphingobacterium hotanense]MDM1047278.1 RagB/SusD family nutrient uptake outer membrane protein [Sphingobacterium hotanense]